MAEEWSNWSGSVSSRPRRIERPRTEAEVQEIVQAARRDGLDVRVVGTGHSFMPIAATNGVLLSLDELSGLESHSLERREATVFGGTKLKRAGELLLERGLAMENLGDIDVQSIAGAIGTGTHGTGPTFGNIPTQVKAMRIVTADGGVLRVSAEDDPEVFRAARVSMGTLGITTAVELRLKSAFLLHERTWRMPFDDVMAQLEELVANNEHFEFFWYPGLDVAECKSLNETTQQPESVEGIEGERIGWSANIIPSVREMKFNEMEYSVPADAGPECVKLIRARLAETHPNVRWPIEYRTLAADDAFLSTAFDRATVTISLHEDARRPFAEFFADIESIFSDHGGRPHWGKIHTRTRDELRGLYPMWDRFAGVRARLDPEGRFLNGYLRTLFGG